MSSDPNEAPYDTLKVWKSENVEERKYPELSTVCTTVRSHSIDAMGNGAFMKLFRYIKGANKEEQKIAMTKPVFTESPKTTEPSQLVDICMHFFLLGKVQSSAPEPTEEGVVLSKIPQQRVYSRRYSGYSSDSKVAENLQALTDSLDKLELPYDLKSFYVAVYDSPFKLFYRRNEIIVKAT